MRRKRCCFLSMDSLAGYVSDDELAIGPLADLGWDVETVSWRSMNTDWNEFDLVVVRTTWDYQSDPAAFLSLLETIESSKARLENSLDIVKWNLDKRYLRELAGQGINVVPTIWDSSYDKESFDGWVDELNTKELIIKPTISATAEHTYRMRAFDADLSHVFRSRPFMVQPFIETVVSEGEYSLFYLGGKYSHTILKTPKNADFRVQEEHGGIISAAKPNAKLRETGREVFELIRPCPLYARVDLVRDAADNFALMELELIEPALYLRMDSGAPRRFASAIDDRMKNGSTI